MLFIGLKWFYWFCKLFGLCPIHYDYHKSAFNWSTLEILYSIFIWAMFSYFFPTSSLIILSRLNPLVIIVFFYLVMGTISIIFVVMFVNVQKMTVLMNETMNLINELQSCCRQISNQQSIRAAISFILKTIVTSSISQFGSIYGCIILCQLESNDIHYFMVFMVSMAYFLQTIVPNMFYVFILCVSMAYNQLNAEIENISNRANFYAKYCNNSKSKDAFEKLTIRLNHIASLHGKLTAHTIKVNQVFSWQLLIVIGNFFTSLLIEVNNLI